MPTKPNAEPSHLDKVIDDALSKLEELDPASEEFAQIVDQLEKLYKMSPKKDSWMKPELILPIAGNLLGIIAILNYEQAHVLTTKAFGLLLKPRV